MQRQQISSSKRFPATATDKLMRRKAILFPATALFVLAGSYGAAKAADELWIGGGADGNWSTGLNWSTGVAPGSTSTLTSTDTAFFGVAIANTWGNSALNPVVIDSATQDIGNINFVGAPGAYFIGNAAGNSLFLTSGGTIQISAVTEAATVTETINAPLVIAGANGTYTLANNSGTGATNSGILSFGAGGISGGTAGNTMLTLRGTNTLANTISGVISDGSATSLSLVKLDAGTWNLTAADTYSGSTTIGGGTVSLGLTTAVSTGSIQGSTAISLINGGSLSLINSVANVDRILDTATVSFSRSAALTLTGNGSVNTSETVGAITLDQGSSTVTIGSASGRITTLNAASLTRANGGVMFIRGSSLNQSQATNVSRFILADGGTSLSLVGTNTINNGGTTETTKGLKIVPYLFGDTSISGTGSNFLTYDGTLGLRVLQTGEDVTLAAGSTTNVAAPENAVAAAATLTTSALTVNSLLFSSAVTLDGTTTALTVNSGAIASTTGNAILGSGLSVSLGNNEGIVFVGAGNLTSNAVIGVTGSGGLTKAGAGTFTVAANTLGYTGDTTIDAGTMTLTGANTSYLGNFIVDGGTLAISTANGAYTGNIVIKAGTLTVNDVNAVTSTNVQLGDTTGNSNATFSATKLANKAIIVQSGNTGTAIVNYADGSTDNTDYTGSIQLGSTGGTGHGVTITTGAQNGYTGVIKDPTGLVGAPAPVTLALNGAISYFGNVSNSYLGGTIMIGGALSIGASGGTGNWFSTGPFTFNGGSFNQQNSQGTVNGISSLILNADVSTSNRALTFNAPVNLGATGIAATRTFTINNDSTTLSGIISNGTNGFTTGIAKGGGSPLILGGASNYTGNTTINAGIIQLTTGTNRLPVTTNVNIAVGAKLDLNGQDQTIAGLGDVVANAGGLVVDGGASKTLTITGTGTFDGGLTNAANALNLVKSTGGTQTLTASQAYTGATTVSGGTLIANGASSVATSQAATFGTSATVTTSASGLFVGEKLSGTGIASGSYITAVGATTITLSANTTIAGSSITLGAYSALGTGNINVTGGTLQLNGSTLSTQNVTVGAGTLAGTGTVGGAVAFTGGGTLTSAGTLTLSSTLGISGAAGATLSSGIVAVTGTTTVNASSNFAVNGTLNGVATVAGTLKGIGTAGAVTTTSAGTIAPGIGNIGTLNTGTLNMTAGGTYAAEINTATATSDKIAITGDLDLAGSTAVLSLTDLGGDQSLGSSLTLVSYTGTWDTGIFSTFAEGSSFTFGSNTYTINYDTDLGGGLHGVTLAVPEPTSLGLLGLGVGSLLARRRRSKR